MRLILTEEEKNNILDMHGKARLLEQSNSRLDGTKMKASQKYFDAIKEFEGDPRKRSEGVKQPILTAYDDGTGVMTIGYGHTEGVKKGDTVTKQEALKLLYIDSTEAANCVRRFLNGWKSQGLESHKLTQGEFDALVSLVFNSGCEAVRESDFIQLLKKGENEKAGTSIKNYRSGGLESRREAESKMFLS